jgi:hypothetical protein
MRYPLSDTEQYKGKIIFAPVQENYIDVPKTATSTVSEASNALSQFTSAATSTGSLSDTFGSGNSFTQAPPKKQVSRLAPSGPVTLYLPQAINVADQVSYGERIDLGTIGAVGAAALKSGKSLLGSVYDAGSETGKSMMDFITNPSGMRSELASLAAVRLAPGGVASGAAKSVLGVTVNPNTKALFRGVELRTFTFTFKMIASSEAEAQSIEDIVKAFRTELYPETINADPEFFNVPIGYHFPNKYRITMMYNGEVLPIRFLDSNLLSVQTTYNPSSMGWHYNGKPSEVDLTLAFGEPRTLSKQDIADGY